MERDAAGDARGPQLISVPRKEGEEKEAAVAEAGDGRREGVEGVPIYTSILNLLR